MSPIWSLVYRFRNRKASIQLSMENRKGQSLFDTLNADPGTYSVVRENGQYTIVGEAREAMILASMAPEFHNALRPA